MLLIDRALVEAFLYPARPGDHAGDGRLIAADARSGAVLWDSRSARAALLPAALEHAPAMLEDAQGRAYRAYFGDSAGTLWRLDLPPGPTEAWRLSRLADLEALASVSGRVSFPVAPELFRAVDGTGRPFDGLLLPALVEEGAGSRIDLLLVRDYALDPDAPLVTVVAADLDAARDCETAGCPPDAGPGWYLADAAPGDALAVAPLIDGGRVFLATHTRLSRACDSASAERFVVVVDLETATPMLEGTSGDALSLGRQALEGPYPVDGAIRVPGLAEALAAQGVGERFLAAKGLATRRYYWLDLLLDSD
ncbi:MAG: hypothetical protein ACX93N_06950 [Pseudohaliea sp.]